MFRSGTDPAAIARTAPPGDGGGEFYALLYTGLWHEAHGSPAAARSAMEAAADAPYARLSGDYMAAVARVHCLQRGWRTL